MRFPLAPLSLCLALLLPAAARAQQSSEQLRFVLIVSRHGVRSPTKPNSVLNRYSAEPWPSWEVAPGELTPRGAALLERFAAFNRQLLTRDGLLPSTGCPGPGSVYVLADTDQRTLASGTALAEGMAPGCHLEIHSAAPGTDDALFHFLAGATPDASTAAAALTAVRAQAQAVPAASNRHALEILNGILAPAGGPAPAIVLADGPAEVKAASGDHLAEIGGSLSTASMLSEALLLEYADGKSGRELGWGRLQPADLPALLSLHTAYFDLIHRTPPIARAEGSNLLSHIASSLRQASTGKVEAGAIGNPGQKVVLVVGHDTNLAALASLLGLHWTLDGRPDDTPPGAELNFELWQNAQTGQQTVRIVYRMQTLGQLRDEIPLTLQQPPATVLLKQPLCGDASSCPLPHFLDANRNAIDPAYTEPKAH